MEQQDNTFTILENEIFYFDSLGDLSPAFLAKTGYNAVLHCRKGSVDVSLADGRHIAVNSRQLLLIPAYKMTGPVTTSNDVIGGILFISDKMLKSLLGKQINIWNKAIYVDETFLIGGGDWLMDFGQYTHALFRRKHMSLFDEIVRSYMRTLLLSFCEELAEKAHSGPMRLRAAHHPQIPVNHLQERQRKRSQQMDHREHDGGVLCAAEGVEPEHQGDLQPSRIPQLIVLRPVFPQTGWYDADGL